LFIVVNYGTRQHTANFCNDVLAQDFGACRALVVDTTRHDCDYEALTAVFRGEPRVTVTHPDSNLGYFGGAAWGLRSHVTERAWPGWIIVANADTRIPDPGFVSALIRAHGENGRVILAPRIQSLGSGLNQNPYLRARPTAGSMHLKKWLTSSPAGRAAMTWQYRAKQLWRQQARSADSKLGSVESIYAPHGAFVAIGREYFSRGGGLEPGTFLYSEEYLLAETARRIGVKVIYDPRFIVMHHEHATTGNNPLTGIYGAQAARYCADEYFPLTGIRFLRE
jgi:GT2 family glycosyltransferase